MSERTPLLGSMSGPLLVPKTLWRLGAAFTAGGIMAGAFGAHGLSKRHGIDEHGLKIWERASTYLIFNGLGIMLVSMHPRFSVHRFAGPAIALGSFLFSSTIFALVLNREKFKVIGPITPMGGSLMIAGYLSLLF